MLAARFGDAEAIGQARRLPQAKPEMLFHAALRGAMDTVVSVYRRDPDGSLIEISSCKQD